MPHTIGELSHQHGEAPSPDKCDHLTLGYATCAAIAYGSLFAMQARVPESERRNPVANMTTADRVLACVVFESCACPTDVWPSKWQDDVIVEIVRRVERQPPSQVWSWAQLCDVRRAICC